MKNSGIKDFPFGVLFSLILFNKLVWNVIILIIFLIGWLVRSCKIYHFRLLRAHHLKKVHWKPVLKLFLFLQFCLMPLKVQQLHTEIHYCLMSHYECPHDMENRQMTSPQSKSHGSERSIRNHSGFIKK